MAPLFAVGSIIGGTAFIAVGVCLAYDLRGLGERWIGWKRKLGPDLGLSAWLDRTLDGAAVAWLGVAVAWAGSGALV